MRQANAQFRAVTQLRLEPIIDFSVIPAVGLFPDVFGLQHRHLHFLPADGVHLFPHNLGNIVQHALAERQKGVHPSHFLVNIASLDQQLSVARRLVRRHVFAGFGK